MDSECLIKLNSWVNRFVDGSLHADFSDIHIDTLSSFYGSKSRWIEGIIDATSVCNQMVSHIGNKCGVSGAIDLRSEEHLLGVNFSNKVELEREFGPTPPTVYLFAKGRRPWEELSSPAVRIDIIDVHLAEELVAFYSEGKLEASVLECARAIWIVPKLLV